MELRYLYVGSTDTERDVAAVVPGSWPYPLIADHHPAGSVLPIFAVEDLDAVVDAVDGHGWTLDLGPMGTPEGPACAVRTPV